MEQTTKPARSEELRALLDKWEQRLHPEFLNLGLDIREFWRRWENDPDTASRKSVRELKLVEEMVLQRMQRCLFDARPQSLEALADDE
jgi:hypothetical protein